MTFEHLVALALFAAASSLTPGPNNLMLLASGANFGFRRSLPHMLGIGIGFCLMVALVGLGLAQIFERHPSSQIVLKLLSTIYLLWLAYKIATTTSTGRAQATSRPMTFFEAAAFQWVNPKAWAMALSATATYAPDQEFRTIMITALVFAAVNLPSVSTWTLLGQQISPWLSNPIRLRAFNRTMAALIVASLFPVLLA